MLMCHDPAKYSSGSGRPPTPNYPSTTKSHPGLRDSKPCPTSHCSKAWLWETMFLHIKSQGCLQIFPWTNRWAGLDEGGGADDPEILKSSHVHPVFPAWNHLGGFKNHHKNDIKREVWYYIFLPWVYHTDFLRPFWTFLHTPPPAHSPALAWLTLAAGPIRATPGWFRHSSFFQCWEPQAAAPRDLLGRSCYPGRCERCEPELVFFFVGFRSQRESLHFTYRNSVPNQTP